ncbi:hypothetical protein [Dactylosporangium sp. CA-233914]|uniref:hypothetical protein n=1 Tax=Dactylosporangium sp. CA-233914 TaxID=3239934 RepID=UPI003D8EBA5E
MDQRNWWVAPGLGIGPLRFGTPRSRLRAALGPARPFRRDPASPDLTDVFAGGVELTCSPQEGLYLIEIADPIGVHHLGVPLAGRSADVVAALRAARIPVEPDDSGWTIAGGAALLYAPDTEVEAIAAYSPRRAGSRVAGFPRGVDAVASSGSYAVAPGGSCAVAPGGSCAIAPARSYTVVPGRGLDALPLGTARNQVRTNRNGGVGISGFVASDTFPQEGLTVHYDARGRAARICVTRAAAVLFDGVNLLPPRPATSQDVRAALAAAGHPVAEEEAALLVPGTGIEIWTTRPGPALPVCAVSVTR